jgi:hypothetical protein
MTLFKITIRLILLKIKLLQMFLNINLEIKL